MAKNESQRLKPESVTEDTKRCNAIVAMSDYKPSQAKYAKGELTAACTEVTDARKAEAEADADAIKTRERTVRAEWALHNLVLGAKEQVVAQYGNEADEVKTVGLKKKSEYKRPTRKNVTPLSKAA